MENFNIQNETIFSSYSSQIYANQQDLEFDLLSNQRSFEDCFNQVFNIKLKDQEFDNDNGYFFQKGIFRIPKENKQIIENIYIKEIISKTNNKFKIQNDLDDFYIKEEEDKKKQVTKIDINKDENEKIFSKQMLEIKEIGDKKKEKKRKNKMKEIKKEEEQKEIKEIEKEKKKKEKKKDIIKIEKIDRKEERKIKNKSKFPFKIFNEGSIELMKILRETKIDKKKNEFFIQETEIEEIKNDYPRRKKKAKKEKIKRKRKFKPDDIRKKIKARFHKILKNIINEKLKQAGSTELFDFLPQGFLSNISKEKNKEVMKLTYRQILEKDFTIELKENKLNKIKVDKVKYEKNLNVLKYLDNNIKIANDSGFTFISNMTYADILKEYFLSQEFEHSINKLRHEKENEDYIKEYIIKAKTYVKFFMKHKEINNDDSSIVSDEEI